MCDFEMACGTMLTEVQYGKDSYCNGYGAVFGPRCAIHNARLLRDLFPRNVKNRSPYSSIPKIDWSTDKGGK